jgi:hypothetical protein
MDEEDDGFVLVCDPDTVIRRCWHDLGQPIPFEEFAALVRSCTRSEQHAWPSRTCLFVAPAGALAGAVSLMRTAWEASGYISTVYTLYKYRKYIRLALAWTLG